MSLSLVVDNAQQAAAGEALAIIDVGSNSVRMNVVRLEQGAHVSVSADSRAALRLVREMASGREIGAKAIERTVAAIRGFQAIAAGAGATQTIAVATSAVREAANGDQLIAQIRKASGITVQIIDGDREASYGFLGAVHALPVDHGLVLDVGGGSIQLTHFRDRRPRRYWSLPLGALRMSDRFLTNDPPSSGQVNKLREHVRETLANAEIRTLGPDEHLVGTGGTVRNLAKIDRRTRTYPILRLHGYTLQLSRVRNVAALVASRAQASRSSIPGLNQDRADSIVGGALVAQTVMELVAARQIEVSGYGLREGLALHNSFDALPPSRTVRRASIIALASRFNTWDAEKARRREQIALALLEALDPDGYQTISETLALAASVLDIGRSVDFYSRHDNTARMLLMADLCGFSHRSIAELAAVVDLAEDDGALKQYEPLLTTADRGILGRAAAALALADEMEPLLPGGHGPLINVQRRGDEVALAAAVLDAWPIQEQLQRLERSFGVRVQLADAERDGGR